MGPVRKSGSRVLSAMIVSLALVAMTAMTGTGQALAATGTVQALAASGGSPRLSSLRLPAGATAVPALSSGPDTTCPTVFLIGARGSGETSGGAFHGLGAEVNKLLSVAAGYLKGKSRQLTYRTYAVNYPSLSVNVLKPTDIGKGLKYYYDHNIKRYVNSIVTGRKDLVALAHKLHNRCSSTAMIFAGYSQGAMVVHQAVNALAGRGDEVLPCIYGTILLGDGDRVPHAAAKEFGTSPSKGEGIGNWIASELGLSLGPDVNSWPSRANICNNYDVVCDTSLAAVLHFSTSAGVHTSYAKKNKNGSYTYEKVLTTAANWDAGQVWSRLNSAPQACGLS